ncbi:MAG: transposase [Chitinophagaceae bacterium]
MRRKTSPDTSGSKKQSSNRRGAQQLFYTEAFKQKIVNEVLSGKLNKRQASLIYGIKGNATILYWINQSQGLKGYEAKAKSPANFAEMKKNIQDKKLEEENKELKELLRVAELRADLWQHAIEVAEKKFNIDILKKYGAQQSTPSKSKGQKEK